ncbi:MAG: hypothetical protein A3G41_00070 [Elusimicrobia bacterium RIFCSPLOWO2_12_FULL_59_9]|nr:MAG: hypothetical protein A3G41_00070 [Elusimicrobia bacterium RIFCSPLOWO2_12_FULL_59_9]
MTQRALRKSRGGWVRFIYNLSGRSGRMGAGVPRKISRWGRATKAAPAPAARIFLAASALAWTLAASASASKSYTNLAAELTQAALSHHVSQVAVLPFNSTDNSEFQDGSSVSERLITQMVRLGRVRVVERELLDKVMREQRLMQTGAVDVDEFRQVGRLLPVEAIITGSVSPLGDQLEVHARLIEVGTGKVLFALQAEFENEWFDAPFQASAEPLPAQAGAKPEACDRAGDIIDSLVISILDLKARYWALKVREPDFSYIQLTLDPGAKILNQRIRVWFYDLLTAWYNRGDAPRLTPSEHNKLMQTEVKILNLVKTCQG